MFWQEDEDKSVPYEIPDDIIDLSFSIQCKKLPIDHAWELSQALKPLLPWAKDDPGFFIHQIHVAETGNGWLRPEDTENEFLWPSRRTKMHLRLSKERQQDAESLIGKTIELEGNSLTIGKTRVKELTNASVIFSRTVISHDDEGENEFLERMYGEIINLTGVKVRKMICGKSHEINTPDRILNTRHLMIADLDSDPSVKIQQAGLGEGHHLGCGIFLPHKGIKSLNATD